MTEFTPVAGLLGGAMIGAAAALLLLLNRRIAGISGIAAGGLFSPGDERIWRLAFVVGLIAGPLVVAAIAGEVPEVSIAAGWPWLVAGGLLVGFGTRLGGGCTSGHGVCGLARLSRRSLVATLTFMAVAAATVFVVRHLAG